MMKPRANAHTHTIFCDGKDTAEDMVKAAIAAGFHTIGFSGHSYLSFDDTYPMSRENTLLYRQEIHRLQQKYAGQIHILLGLEWDWFSKDIDRKDYDYVIGSVHHLYSEETKKYYTLDYLPEEFAACLKEAFHGDTFAMAKAYYDFVKKTAAIRKPDIIGHLDLIRKLNTNGRFFDERDPRYLELAKDAALCCIQQGCIIEINTGGMFKKYRDTPYPDEPILRFIAEHHGKITINSDSHSTDSIDYYFEESVELAKRTGFTEFWELSPKGFVPVSMTE